MTNPLPEKNKCECGHEKDQHTFRHGVSIYACAYLDRVKEGIYCPCTSFRPASSPKQKKQNNNQCPSCGCIYDGMAVGTQGRNGNCNCFCGHRSPPPESVSELKVRRDKLLGETFQLEQQLDIPFKDRFYNRPPPERKKIEPLTFRFACPPDDPRMVDFAQKVNEIINYLNP